MPYGTSSSQERHDHVRRPSSNTAIASFARAVDPACTTSSIAIAEGRSEHSIRMTLSLAFLAPEIVEAALNGQLPPGFGLKRLTDLPANWNGQWRQIGLAQQA